jgi:hypothetical protein
VRTPSAEMQPARPELARHIHQDHRSRQRTMMRTTFAGANPFVTVDQGNSARS